MHLPMLADIARDSSPFLVIQKAAQVGISELIVSMVLWATAVRFAGRGNVMLLHPTQQLMDDFTKTRIDPAIQDSASIRRLLQPEPPRRKGADSLRVKRIGDGYLALRGSESRRQIATFDADWVMLDEADQMEEDVYELAERRLGSSSDGRLWVVSTPALPEAGINAYYRQSDQHRRYLQCPACKLMQPLTWADNVDLESARRVCRECHAEMDVLGPGQWVAVAPGNRIRGYHISKLYSPWANIRAMVEASESTSPIGQQHFYSSDLGETYSPPGGGLSLEEIDRCRHGYSLEQYGGQATDMGVDVGTRLHVVIREHVSKGKQGKRRLWFAGDVGWEDLDGLLEQYRVRRCVIDSQPEGHTTRTFGLRHRNKVWLAYYGRQESGTSWPRGKSGQPNICRINRTESLDAVVQSFRDGLAALPRNARRLGGRFRERDGAGEYYRQLLAIIRTLAEDGHGNPVARWASRGDDHYAHAEVYCAIASEGSIGGSIRFIPIGPDPRLRQGWPEIRI